MGLKAIIKDSFLHMIRRPIYWVATLFVPLLSMFLLTDLMHDGLPTRIPAGIVDLDNSKMSRSIHQTIEGMQMVNIIDRYDSFSQARQMVQNGEIFGFFFIPDDFQQELLSGRSPIISFYTNMTYYIPASLLYKTFKTTALYAKANTAIKMLENTGASQTIIAPLIQPVNISVRGLNNPETNYAIYLCNSFIPAMIQLMIFLTTSFSLSHRIKTGRSRLLMRYANGSIIKAVVGQLLPQTIIWWIIVIFMQSWLFGWCGYPMNGSWIWLTLSQLLFVLASQGFALFFTALLSNLRIAVSASALIGVLSFSVAAFSMPYESMYGAIGIFSWILPTRYNFLIYIDQALNGIDIYYSRFYFAAYIVFIIAPFSILWKLKKAYNNPIYIP